MITHKQAFYIHACGELFLYRIFGDKEVWDELERLGLIQDVHCPTPTTSRVPTDLGDAALAEYEDAHVTLTKDQLGEVFKAGYEHGWNDRTGNHDEVDERWRDSNIWDNLQAEKP